MGRYKYPLFFYWQAIPRCVNISRFDIIINSISLLSRESSMKSKEFATFRKQLNKTQKQMAQLLGVSIKAVHSYEQGWRTVPPHVERQMFFLMARKRKTSKTQKPCWTVKKCPTKQKKECPAWEFQAGKFCWFVNGTICCGTAHEKWKEKMKLCRSCEVMAAIM